MDIREIQALHAQYSSQPVVIDIDSHVRALPAPAGHESTRKRTIETLKSTYRRVGRPTAIVLALALGAGVAGVSAAKLWHAAHARQAAVHVEPAAAHSASAATAHAAAPAAASASASHDSKRPLTSADFAEPVDRTAADASRMEAQALQASQPKGPTVPPDRATPEPMTDQEKVAASPIRPSRAASVPAAGKQSTATTPADVTPTPSATVAQASTATAPAVAPTAQPKPAPHRAHRAAGRQRHEAASAEAPSPAVHTEPAKVENSPKPSTSAKTGDVSLF
ncbi:hypothetical protein [Burkholderia metallica]|uniref:hypothetical protein n=1 Tax=Burkholderia metallica TaxID=488729 RepID=UPI001CF5E894|nr:hypothetical protein [Burkholderia metallica]MCA8022734.1 hypothetical protein [Burkholderia metallica]